MSENQIDLVVGRNLRALRLASGASVDTLAEALGCTAAALERYESGTDRLRPEHMLVVLQHLRTRAGALFVVDTAIRSQL